MPAERLTKLQVREVLRLKYLRAQSRRPNKMSRNRVIEEPEREGQSLPRSRSRSCVCPG
jgi:hypothetical protein